MENDSDMEFLNGIFGRGSGHKLEFEKTRVFLLFSTIIFTFYKMLFMNRLEFSCIPDFVVRISTTREE
jgi:hypothetical protein